MEKFKMQLDDIKTIPRAELNLLGFSAASFLLLLYSGFSAGILFFAAAVAHYRVWDKPDQERMLKEYYNIADHYMGSGSAGEVIKDPRVHQIAGNMVHPFL